MQTKVTHFSKAQTWNFIESKYFTPQSLTKEHKKMFNHIKNSSNFVLVSR